jgi:hypothetical protein
VQSGLIDDRLGVRVLSGLDAGGLANDCDGAGTRSAYIYRSSGLRLLSEIALPGLIPDSDGDGEFDVVVRNAQVPEHLSGAEVHGPTWESLDGRFLIAIPGVARFLITNGQEIAVQPEPGTETAEVAIFLIGTVLGILLHQRQQIVLHASAVRVGGKAVLFCGASGAGKSTIAAALSQRGFPLVNDDVCAIDLSDPGRIMVQPDGRLLKLWAHAIDNLELAESRGAAVRARLEKFYVEPGAATGSPLPLGAIYALREARPPHEAGIEKPNVVDSALLLRRNAYRPLLVRRLGQKENYFHAAAAIANTAGIYHLTRPLDFAAMPDVIGSLRGHWAEIGLAETPP